MDAMGGVRSIGAMSLALSLSLSGCVFATVDAGHEGVLVEKPFFLGHGGVDTVPMSTGRQFVALTTEVVDVDIRPIQY